jgi:hypothetical protein
MDNQNQTEPTIRATYTNVPDHSDLRGFSYRGPDSEDHPENNEKFEMSAAEGTGAGTTGKAGADDQASISMEDAEAADLNPDDLEEDNDLGAGVGNEGPQNVDIDEDDNEDVLEEVRGGLRADVPDEIEYDDTDANARRRAG